ncbi:hypothetical protein RHSIM_Rhsim12G0214100 [Rhododendron simsii]|uniref:Small nuclear ribonucleoprotein E n=1 Tax=Rhododendron simsii TaxID=118357 RepID=A0A834G2E0_RHOSS|nr:hypothetical protein RHSIM_Rhsim12G0214100 [Rhododendron simsii]
MKIPHKFVELWQEEPIFISTTSVARGETNYGTIKGSLMKARIQIWLFEQKDLRIEGRIIGFDEYMNLVLEDAEEVNIKKKSRKALGRILLKGDNITLMMNTGK